jgi:nitrate reductase NapE component
MITVGCCPNSTGIQLYNPSNATIVSIQLIINFNRMLAVGLILVSDIKRAYLFIIWMNQLQFLLLNSV